MEQDRIITPRWWTKKQLSEHMNRSVQWLTDNYAELVKAGLPDKDPLFKMWDSAAVIAWEDERSMLADPSVREMQQLKAHYANGEI